VVRSVTAVARKSIHHRIRNTASNNGGMSLTLGRHRPLSSTGPVTVNYEIDGPRHRLFFDPFPRRIRAFYGGELVLDSVRAMLLHESNLMVVLYVPREDVLATMTETEHTTHCPFKGDASYWDVAAGGQTASNAAWGYLEPQPEASWLAGYVAFYWDAMDAWFDEDEETGAHPRDPYTRIDVRRTSRPVQVSVRGEVVAESRGRWCSPRGTSRTASTCPGGCPRGAARGLRDPYLLSVQRASVLPARRGSARRRVALPGALRRGEADP